MKFPFDSQIRLDRLDLLPHAATYSVFPLLFNSELLQGLCECSVIIELHDFSEDRSQEKDLCRLAAKYFHIEHVKELPVDPSSIPELSVYDNESRLLSLSEGRPCVMNWLLLTPKSEKYFENRV
jgi:hypothetical protein